MFMSTHPSTFRPQRSARTLRARGRFSRPLLLLFLLLAPCSLLLSSAHAQSVRWDVSDSGDPSELLLIFENCAPDGEPQLPKLDGTTLAFTGRSEQTSIVNFSMTRSVIYSYRARSQKSGPIQIPAFTVQTNKGPQRVAAFTGGATRSAADASVSARLDPGATSVWAGQVFPLTYVLDVPRSAFNQLGSNIEWNAAPLVVEEWSKFEPSEGMANGEARLRITAKTRGYAKNPGPLTLNAANQLVNLQAGSMGFGLFQTPRIEQLAVASNAPALVVRPLPPPPAGYTGAVGQFKLTSKVVPAQAAVGEPVTWTLELSGTGNWPDIAGLPQREVSRNFRVVQPQAKRTPAEGKLFDVTLSEDVVLIPTEDGTYTLGPVNFVYFDPATGDYKTLTTPRTTVAISAPAPAPVATTPAPSTSDETPANGAPRFEIAKIKPPAPPAPIPRDPLPGSASAPVPLRSSLLVALAVAPFVLLLGFWFALAYRRARSTDPLQNRREARARLIATLAALRHAPAASVHALLLQWQHDARLLLGLHHAAPPPTALADPTWSRLWAEADAALYRADGSLPSDWVARADVAVSAQRIPGISPFHLFLPRNLLPFVASLLLASAATALLLPASLRAAELAKPATDARTAYRSGDFAAAADAWRKTVATAPTDAIARHNLSLALIQQDRFGEAGAQAAAAFVQAPSEPAIRWNFLFAVDKSGAVPAPLQPFLSPGPLQSLASQATPGAWQRAILGAAALAALSLGWLLAELYHRRRRWVRISATSLFALCGIALALAAACVHAYGLAADRRAVIAWRAGTLRSIPTEADNTQKTSVLAPGSVAVIDEENSFLGWVRLTFPNGQTGWVRRDEVIGLWR